MQRDSPASPALPLAVDRTEIARFVHALFSGLDDRGFVSLRAFRQSPPKGERDIPLHIEAIRLNLGLEPVIDRAVVIATRIANGGEAGVFAPPITTFTGRNGAKSGDVHEAPTLSLEIDQGDLEQIADGLSLILGERPTIALHSGSLWADPATRELRPKGHLHWRLHRPARGPEQQQMLRRARDIATLLAGGDPTGAPQVHPLRWPGSWNRKTDPPVMARIVEQNATTIDLVEALAALEDAAQASGIATPRNVPHLVTDDLPAELAQLAEWLTFYTTACLRAAGQGLWHDWNKVAMALHRATGGSEAGYLLFRAWSAPSPHYTEAGCRSRWDAITGCPATWIGARFLRRMAIEHGWRPPAPEKKSLSSLPAYYPAPTEDRDTAIAQQNETIVAHLFEAERLAEARREVRRRRDAAIGDADFMSDTSDGLTPAEKAAITKRIYREVAQQFGYGDRLPQPPLQLNTGSQGTGKTTTTIKTIAATPTASTFQFTEPTLDKASEVMEDYRRIATPESPPSRLILGRGRKDPKRPGHYMCDRHEAAKHVVQAGLSVGETMCETCKLQDICGHNRQKREVAAIVAEGDGLVAFAASDYVFLKSPLHSPDHLIVDESVLKLATTSFDVKLDTLDDLPIARPADIVMDALRGAFDDLDDIAIPQGAMTGLTTMRQALSELEAAPDPVGHPALTTIRIVLDELNDCEMPSEAKSALTALDRALRELETIPEARATHETLLRIRNLIAMPRPIAALLAADIDGAKLREIRAALNTAIQQHTPEIDGTMRDGTIIERTETAENGPYGRLRRAADLMRAILVEIGHWGESFDNIVISDGAVRIGKHRKQIALEPLAKLPVRHLGDICQLLTEPKPITALRKADLDMKLGYVKGLLDEAIAAAEPGTDEHLRQADDLLAAMIPEINRQRATFNAVVVRNGVAEVSKRREPICGSDTSLLLLDGTGDADWNRRIFGTDRLHHEHTPVPRMAHITGTRSRRYSAMSFTATNRNGKVFDNRLPAAAKLREDINTILSRLPPGQTMIAATKRVEDALFASGAIPADTPTAHFGALRGLNRWQDARAAVVIGGETIPLNALERMARAFLADDPQPFVSMDQPAPEGWPLRQWPYVATRMRRMADGSLSAVKVEVHPDARVQGFYEQIREAEAVQALDRTRPVWHRREIVLLGNLCLDVDYNRVLRHAELVAGGDKLDRAFLATGFVPRSPQWLHRAHPTIFPTVAMAEHALRNYREFLNRWSIWDLAVVSFRTLGQRGPASEAAIDPSRHPDLQAAVEAVTGPLEEFQGVGLRSDTETPATEPVMQPGITPEPRQPGSGGGPPSNMVHGPPDG